MDRIMHHQEGLQQAVKRHGISTRTSLDAAWQGGQHIVGIEKELPKGQWLTPVLETAQAQDYSFSRDTTYRWRRLYLGYPNGVPAVEEGGPSSISEALRRLKADGNVQEERPSCKCSKCGYDGQQLQLQIRELREENAFLRQQGGHKHDWCPEAWANGQARCLAEGCPEPEPNALNWSAGAREVLNRTMRKRHGVEFMEARRPADVTEGVTEDRHG